MEVQMVRKHVTVRQRGQRPLGRVQVLLLMQGLTFVVILVMVLMLLHWRPAKPNTCLAHRQLNQDTTCAARINMSEMAL